MTVAAGLGDRDFQGLLFGQVRRPAGSRDQGLRLVRGLDPELLQAFLDDLPDGPAAPRRGLLEGPVDLIRRSIVTLAMLV